MKINTLQFNFKVINKATICYNIASSIHSKLIVHL